ncbi:MAG TPA: polysaccharide biosynthesis/export family protein [Sphingobium sp.]|nr:polysaccharide biosynthesis/export family protein [Sphingobium sp.]
MRALIPGLLVMVVAGCTIPRSGGLKSELSNPPASADYVVRRLDQSAIARSRVVNAPELPEAFKAGVPQQDATIRAGDRLSLTIIESTGGSTPSAINGLLKLDLVVVGPDGQLTVPYAGAVMVAGQSIEVARRVIEARLRTKLYQPQVVLRMVDGGAQTVSIMGDVGKGGSYPLGPEMSRLADLIGASGLSSEKPEQVNVAIQRADLRGQTTLRHLLDDGSSNVFLQGGDVVTVHRAPRYVTVIGAAGTPGRVEIAGPDFSLLDALAVSGGLSDNSADPAGVFLFSAAETAPPPASVIVYEVDIRDPAQVRLARDYRLAQGDVVYVATASFAQTRKVLSAISGSLSTVARIP